MTLKVEDLEDALVKLLEAEQNTLLLEGEVKAGKTWEKAAAKKILQLIAHNLSSGAIWQLRKAYGKKKS